MHHQQDNRTDVSQDPKIMILLLTNSFANTACHLSNYSQDDQSRIVRHFHFTTWPDFGVPEPPVTLVKFVRAFRERVLPDSSKPIVVHCRFVHLFSLRIQPIDCSLFSSAGVGRSGTFIALDRILQHIKNHDYVDIFGIVFEMRKERVWMVQNEVCTKLSLLNRST